MLRPGVLQRLFLILALSSLAAARGGGGCFLPDTLVLTTSGEKPIKSVSAGEEVVTPDGIARVVVLYATNASKYYEITTATTSVNVTGEHLLYIGDGRFKEAAKLAAGDTVVVYSNNTAELDRVVSIVPHKKETEAYNLLVDSKGIFLANSIIAHNKGSFLPDTLVLTADGSWKRISEVKPGDVLKAFTYEGEVINASVIEVYTASAREYYVIRTESYEVNVTAEHPFYLGDGVFVTAERLEPGDRIFVFNGSGLSPERVVSKETVLANVTTYNPRTEWPNTYFANFIAVHNKGGGCFAAGTRIATPEGERHIEAVKAGDMVTAVAPDGSVKKAVVRGVFTTRTRMLQLRTERRAVNTTAEHPFLTPGGSFKEASELSAGDVVMVIGENGELREERIVSATYLGEERVYNLEIEEPFTFIANGFVVHNKGGGGGSGSTPYTHATMCGLPTRLRLTNGSYANGTQCIYVYFLKTNINSARTLENCVKATQEAWRCANLTNFAISRELRFECATREECLGYSEMNVSGIGMVKIVVPPSLEEQLCGMAISLLMFGVVTCGLFWIIRRKSRLSADLDYCYPSSQVDAKAAKTAKLLAYLKSIDPRWDPDELKRIARTTFFKLQECWQSREYAPMQPLLMPNLYAQHVSQLESLKRNHEINKLDDLQLRKLEIVHLRHYAKKDQQEFTVLVEASARDYYVDDRDGRFLRGDSKPVVFQEFWVFQRQGNNWLLREINQTRESDALAEENFVEELTPWQLKNIYGALAAPPIEKAPWLDEALRKKADRVHRMLNFLSSTDKSWDEDFMKMRAREIFVRVLTAFEKRDLTAVEPFLLPEAASHFRSQIDAMKKENRKVEYRNMCVRKVDIVLVKNYNDRDRDEFTARISAHAQRIEYKGEKITRKDEYVTPWEEYWSFRKQNGEWMLVEVVPPARTRSIIEEENIDEEAAKGQVQWYYTKDRAL
ncbi:MAG: TIM44-like domain-containing protein [Candidatus Micrarchaeia archaeon]